MLARDMISKYVLIYSSLICSKIQKTTANIWKPNQLIVILRYINEYVEWD